MAILQVPITKAKSSREVDTEKLPDDVYAEALLLGMKEILNRGTSKLTKDSVKGDEAKLKAEAEKIADAQVKLAMTGQIRFLGAKAKSKVSGAVMVEAMRLARNLIKDAIKADGGKISHVKASEITVAAKALLDEMPEIIEQATAAIAEREKAPTSKALSIAKGIKVDPKKVAATEKEKAERKAALSAKQAGMTAARAKPQAKPQVPAQG